MNLPKSIFYQAQEAVVSALSSDEVLSGRVPFVSENQKDIDFQIKQALGKQGIVGIVMTPQAEYQGITHSKEQVWDLRDFTVQIVENPPVNRGLSGTMTALDAAARSAEVLGSPLFDFFGQYCPVAIEQGEDAGLLVAQYKFNCQVKAYREPPPPPPFDYTKTYVKYAGSDEWVATPLSGVVEYQDTMPYYNSGVVEILLGTGIERLGNETFGEDEFPDLHKIVFADGCTLAFSAGTFGGNSKISALENFENTSIQNIADNSLRYLTALSSLSLPQSLQSIEYEAFEGCSALTSISIPSNCTFVDYYAFNGCSSLKNVTINSPECEVRFDAFINCPSLESVVFVGRTTAQVREMEDYPFGIENTSIIRGTVMDPAITYVKYSGSDEWVETDLEGHLDNTSMDPYASAGVTEFRIGTNVTWLGANSFYKNYFQDLRKISFANGCSLKIEFDAFSGSDSISALENFENVSIPEIQREVLSGFTALKSIGIPSSVAYIGDEAFSNCTSLESVDMQDGLSSIGSNAFENCTSLQYVHIPSTLSNIRENGFINCNRLSSVNLPDGLRHIGIFAFYNCTNLVSVDIPDTVSDFGDCTFENCTSLKKAVIGNGAGFIGGYVFSGCRALEDVTIGSNVGTLYDSAFGGCTSLSSIYIPSNVYEIYSSVFNSCTGLKRVEIHGSDINIRNDAFWNCPALEDLTIFGKTTAEVQEMDEYPWGIEDTSVIHGSLDS